MKIIKWEEFLRGSLKGTDPAAMSIGVFDGVHKGHRDILNKIINNSTEKSIVVTFIENPRILFGDQNYPGDIFTIKQKLESLSSIGIDIVILIDFSVNFSKLTGKEFLFLITENTDISLISLGQNFRFGKNGMTSAIEAIELLKSKNIHVDVEKMTYFEDQLVSSTFIRKAILNGQFKQAQNMLEGVFSLDIADIPQIKREKTIIIDTNNITQVLPPQGQYNVRIGNTSMNQKSNISLNDSNIVIPLQNLQKLEFIKFI
jgi:riboflavin kinase / FMN adenylyltransferase